jgi:hypothetical protein
VETIFTFSLFNLNADFGLGIRNSFLLNTDPLNPNAKSNNEIFVTMNL